MDPRIQHAIALRAAGEYEQSRELLRTLTAFPVLKAEALLNIAWSYDNEGLEEIAAEYYQAALNEGLEGDNKFEAQLGLACTYRCLGKYETAKQGFEEIIRDYPDASEAIPFYALCLHNLGEHDRAMTVMLELVANHPPTAGIQRYAKALAFYSHNLN
ncbi:tetratricopeptide repeat protein [Pseudescherichia vulneris]|uniref:tetratricopeptide repeat protein n=1 Tax=Pseudescherichia vulneris TaxID=566 RepID=UPI00227A1669|nr:tetratricopeptide repeat protein [Pseudescherichia vulneris]WAH52792.1 tetratricopeptide repeat protein [Pseudescherichia vulneris]